MREAQKSFQFYQLCRLTELTGERAMTLHELRDGIARCSAACIFYHTHHAFLRAHRVGQDFTNDFARWVGETLREFHLGERLGGIDVLDYPDLEDLRRVFLQLIDGFLEAEGARVRAAPPEEPFHFMRARTILYPLEMQARTLEELATAITAIPLDSIFFHFIEARVRLGRETNDFSGWLSNQLGEPELARAVDAIDPYVLSLEELRARLLEVLSHFPKAPGVVPPVT